MNRTARLMALVVLTVLIALAGLSLVALAADPDIPIIDRLPEVPILFGVSGGVIVSVLLSVLKYFRVVGKDGPIPTQAANFLLSVLVAAVANLVTGQALGPALLTAFASMVAASGLHETVGHGVQAIVGKS